MERLQKRRNYLFLNVNPSDSVPVWARVGKAEAWVDELKPQVSVYDFVEDSGPTETLEAYGLAASVPLRCYVGDAVYDFVFGLYRRQAVGVDAVTQALRVFQQPEGDGLAATLTQVVVFVESYDVGEGVLTFSIGQRGTPVLGVARLDGGVVFNG